MSNRQKPASPDLAGLSAQDLEDLETLDTELPKPPSYHPILQVWREILAPALDEATKKVTPQWANRIVSAWSELSYSDMNDFRDSYFGKIATMAAIVDFEIETDDQALQQLTLEEDREKNGVHYENVIRNWQLQVLQWELEWDTADPFAHVEIAALSEIHKMFFGEQGLLGFLEQIAFEFDDDAKQSLADALEEHREAHESRGDDE